MDYFIKIMPEMNSSTISLYSWNQFSDKFKASVNDVKFETLNSEGKLYRHGGYVSYNQGKNELRYIVYENLPNFGRVKGKFNNINDAVKLVESLMGDNNE